MADHDVGATKNGGDGPPQPANTAALPTSTSTSSSAMSMSMPAVSKVKLSLGNTKKKKKKSKSSSTTCAATRDTFASSTAALAAASEDGNKTIADLAEENVRKRAERNEGKLVIPLVGGRDGNRPLLANKKGHGRDAAEEGSTTNHVKQEEDDNGEAVSIKAPPAETAIKSEGDRQQPRPDRVKSEAEQNEDDNDDDTAAAMAALVQSAADRTSSSSRRAGDTNFAASGNLIIKQEELRTKLERDAAAADNAEDEEYVDEEEEFKRDLAKQADDVDVESEVYAAVPISEFGAAMLRGMGWTGGDNDNNNVKKKGKDDDEDDMADMRPRHHRLGLGAAPRPVSMSARGSSGATKPGGRHRALRPHELERVEREKRDEELWKKKAEERTRLDKQQTAQVGSVVRIRGADDVVGQQRAILVKTTGVPGLNQVLIRYENAADDVSVRKSDIVLISQAELDERPFVEMKRSSSSSGDKKKTEKNRDEEEKKESGGRSDAKVMRSTDRDESSRSRKRDRSNERYRNHEDRRDRDRRSDRDRRDRDDRKDRDRRSNEKDRDRKRNSSDRKESDRRRSNDGDRDRRRKERDGDYESSRDRKRSKKDSRSERRSRDTRPSRPEPEQQQPAVRWLTPNIRVRVVTKKLAKGRQYKEKGIVLDVLPGGSHATIQMADGEVLDRVPDRYLETALPKVGGNVIVLAGDRQHQHAKGRLLERDSDKGRGVVQLFEDMNVLTLSLDDIAEWCGPLDEDMMG